MYIILTVVQNKGYSHRLNYNWTFHTLQSFHFLVNVTDLNTEGNNRSCHTDMIKLMVPRRNLLLSDPADPSLWRVNRTLCGRFIGSFELPPIHKMRINFLTDSSVNKTGFNLTVSTICGGTVYGPNGYLTTEDVLNQIKCDWVILVREGHTIQLTFEALNIADNNNCQYSYILLRNGHRKSSPLLGGGKYCGRNIPVIPESSSNRVRVEFFARRSLQAVSQPFI